jgi:predicted TIM-barrel fold metal-dependent hydrolase
VERAVLLGWYWANAETCELHNRFYAECVRRHPDRLSAFATVQPAVGGERALLELRRSYDEGLVGIGELSPHSQGYGIESAAFQDVLVLAAELSLPVNVHVTDPNSRDYPGRVETPMEDFISIAAAYPQVKFIFAHWGGLLPLRDAATAQLPNVFYDTAASPLIYDDSVWSRILSVVPSSQVLFGSDYPLNLYPKLENAPTMRRLIAEAIAAKVPPEVLRGNIAALLRL